MDAKCDADWLIAMRLRHGRAFPQMDPDESARWWLWWDERQTAFLAETGESFEAYSERMIGPLELHRWAE